MPALAKCGLTTVLVTLAVMSNVLVTLSVLSGANAQTRGRQPALDWQTFLVPEFGTTVDYPAGIFSVPDGKAEKGFGQRFNSADGRSVLTIYTRENEDGDTPASYLKNNLRVGRTALDYERVAQLLCDLLDAPGADLLQPLQFLRRSRRRHPLLRPGLSAGREARLGSGRHPHQPVAAAAGRLAFIGWQLEGSRAAENPAGGRFAPLAAIRPRLPRTG